jgi:hypothetical protein
MPKYPGPPMMLGNNRSGIVAERRDRLYRFGRSADWINVKKFGCAGCEETA